MEELHKDHKDNKDNNMREVHIGHNKDNIKIICQCLAQITANIKDPTNRNPKIPIILSNLPPSPKTT